MFICERGYPTGYLASHDPQMFFKCVTQLHVYSLITYSDLNQNCESKVIRMKESLLYAILLWEDSLERPCLFCAGYIHS